MLLSFFRMYRSPAKWKDEKKQRCGLIRSVQTHNLHIWSETVRWREGERTKLKANHGVNNGILTAAYVNKMSGVMHTQSSTQLTFIAIEKIRKKIKNSQMNKLKQTICSTRQTHEPRIRKKSNARKHRHFFPQFCCFLWHITFFFSSIDVSRFFCNLACFACWAY